MYCRDCFPSLHGSCHRDGIPRSLASWTVPTPKHTNTEAKIDLLSKAVTFSGPVQGLGTAVILNYADLEVSHHSGPHRILESGPSTNFRNHSVYISRVHLISSHLTSLVWSSQTRECQAGVDLSRSCIPYPPAELIKQLRVEFFTTLIKPLTPKSLNPKP